MPSIPFSVYDFFAYLASGFLVIVALDVVGRWNSVLRNDLGVVFGLFWIGVAYIAGQILAGPSAWLYERVIVGEIFRRPSINLFQGVPRSWWAFFFPGYFEPLPESTRKRILERAKREGVDEVGEPLFLLAFGKVKANQNAMARLATFLNLYGFARNISFACLVAAIALIVGVWQTDGADKWPWLLAAIVGTIGMFYRYLKFFRQYSFELFITYSALPEKEANRGD